MGGLTLRTAARTRLRAPAKESPLKSAAFKLARHAQDHSIAQGGQYLRSALLNLARFLYSILLTGAIYLLTLAYETGTASLAWATSPSASPCSSWIGWTDGTTDQFLPFLNLRWPEALFFSALPFLAPGLRMLPSAPAQTPLLLLPTPQTTILGGEDTIERGKQTRSGGEERGGGCRGRLGPWLVFPLVVWSLVLAPG